MSYKFIKNTVITGGTKVITLISGTIISILIARTLGPENKGVLSLALLLPSMIFMFSQFGIGGATVYYTAKKEYSEKEIINSNILIAALISIISLLVGVVIILFFKDKIIPGVGKEYLLLSLLIVPCKIFSEYIVNILLGSQKIKKYNLITIIQNIILFSLIMFFILISKLNIKTIIISNIVFSSMGVFITLFWLRNLIKIKSLKININYLKNLFSYGFKTYLSNILSIIHSRIDVFMINLFLNPLAVGFYSVSVAMAEKLWIISQSAGLMLFPRISVEKNEKNIKNFTPLVFRTTAIITIIGSLLLYVLSDWLVILLFSKSFIQSIVPFKILLIGIIALGGAGILANDLYGRGKPLINTYVNLISVFLNITLNVIFIPKWGIIGAAWATSISYSVTLLVILIIYSKISKNKIKDIIFLKNSDLRLYRNILISIKNKILRATK